MLGHFRRLGTALEIENELLLTPSPFAEVEHLLWLLARAEGSVAPLLDPHV
jgi:hypothetical protein